MANYEKVLKKRIDSLSKKYKKTVFSKNSKTSLSNKVKKDFISNKK